MEYIKIATIVNTHGLNGNLKVKSFTDFKDERYKKGNTLFIFFKNKYIPVTVSSFRTVKTLETIIFNEFSDINEVEKYKGSDLFISSDLIHDLEEDEFYFEELIGMQVYNDKLIGECIDVREVPQGEMLVIKREGLKDALIPFNKQFVKEVHKEENKIFLINWEGLL